MRTGKADDDDYDDESDRSLQTWQRQQCYQFCHQIIGPIFAGQKPLSCLKNIEVMSLG